MMESVLLGIGLGIWVAYSHEFFHLFAFEAGLELALLLLV